MSMAALIAEAERFGAECRRRSAEYKGGPKPFEFLGNNREADMPWLSDEEVAGLVRMLMRDQFNHEQICCVARDRILHLTQDRARLLTALQDLVDAWEAKHLDDPTTGGKFKGNVTNATKAAKAALSAAR
jgi:hypothetical protein